MGDQSLIDKSMRSVFVGNIPYEATEEKLKDIFSEVGPVLSFKLVYDRETGKPKGYGFCEYKDTETALSAMRNLNGYEIGGRTLRVDNACTEKSRLEMQSLLQSAPAESPYGDPIISEKAPEAISNAVASLPPEQMYEVMKQMKECVQNNPTEAKVMLLQNPQLSYALLQCLVVMRLVDPNVAVTMLHTVNPSPTPLYPTDKPMTVPLSTPVSTASNASGNSASSVTPVAVPTDNWAGTLPPSAPIPTNAPLASRPSAAPIFLGVQDMDMRQQIDPRMSRMSDQDLRIPPAQPSLVHSGGSAPLPVPHPGVHPRDNFPPDHYPSRDPRMASDPRMTSGDPRINTADPRMGSGDPRMGSGDPRLGSLDPRMGTVSGQFPSRDPRDRVDPRTGSAPLAPSARPPVPQPGPPRIHPAAVSAPNLAAAGASDQEKAQLIMQVLQLTDEQIDMLPREQRQSILLLKEQIAKSAPR